MKTITLTISSKDYTVRLEDDFYVAFEQDWREILGGKRFLEPKDLLNAFVKKSFDAYSNEIALKQLCENISSTIGQKEIKDTKINQSYDKSIEYSSDNQEIQNSTLTQPEDDKFDEFLSYKQDVSIDNDTTFYETQNQPNVLYFEKENPSKTQSIATDDIEQGLEFNRISEHEPLSQIDLITKHYQKNIDDSVSLVSLGHKGVTVTLPLSNTPPQTSECVANIPLNELSKADERSMTHIDLLSSKKDKFFGDFFENLSNKDSK